jgi:hypothetical protein
VQKVWAQIRQFAPATETVELDLVVSHKQAVVDYSSHLVLFAQVIYLLLTALRILQDSGSRY